MAKFLIDANLPYRFSLWQGDNFEHVYDIGDDLPDTAIWQYAKTNNLTILTKDADFSDWITIAVYGWPSARRLHSTQAAQNGASLD